MIHTMDPPVPLLDRSWSGSGTAREAVTFLEKALDLNPDDGWSKLWLGNCLWKMGQMDRAGAYYREAIADLPDVAETERWYSQFNAAKEKQEESIREIVESIAPGPAGLDATVEMKISISLPVGSDERAVEQQAVALGCTTEKKGGPKVGEWELVCVIHTSPSVKAISRVLQQLTGIAWEVGGEVSAFCAVDVPG